MINLENIFQRGEFKTFQSGQNLFFKGDPVEGDAIYYIKRGNVKLAVPKNDGTELSLRLMEGDLVGVPEVYADTPRITNAKCESEVECYVWDKASFLLAVAMIWELSLFSIKALSSFLRIINAEFVDKMNISI